MICSTRGVLSCQLVHVMYIRVPSLQPPSPETFPIFVHSQAEYRSSSSTDSAPRPLPPLLPLGLTL